MRSCLLNLGLALVQGGPARGRRSRARRSAALSRSLGQVAGTAGSSRRAPTWRCGGGRVGGRAWITEARALEPRLPAAVRADLVLLRAEVALLAGEGGRALATMGELDGALRAGDPMIDARARVIEASAHLTRRPADPRLAARLAIGAIRAARRSSLPEVEEQATATLRAARRAGVKAAPAPVTAAPAPIQPTPHPSQPTLQALRPPLHGFGRPVLVSVAPAPVLAAPAPVSVAPAPVLVAPAPVLAAPAPVSAAPASVSAAPASASAVPASVSAAPASASAVPASVSAAPASASAVPASVSAVPASASAAPASATAAPAASTLGEISPPPRIAVAEHTFVARRRPPAQLSASCALPVVRPLLRPARMAPSVRPGPRGARWTRTWRPRSPNGGWICGSIRATPVRTGRRTLAGPSRRCGSSARTPGCRNGWTPEPTPSPTTSTRSAPCWSPWATSPDPRVTGSASRGGRWPGSMPSSTWWRLSASELGCSPGSPSRSSPPCWRRWSSRPGAATTGRAALGCRTPGPAQR